MRITAEVSVQIADLDRLDATFVEVTTTNTGVVGVGETVMNRHDRTVPAHAGELGQYLAGKDPAAIETWPEGMYRDSFWVGGPIQAAARSALDMALRDTNGQQLGAPVYELLGGPTLTSIPVYTHLGLGSSPSEFASKVQEAVAARSRAAKIPYLQMPSPHVTETQYLPTSHFPRFAEYLSAAPQRVGVRGAVTAHSDRWLYAGVGGR